MKRKLQTLGLESAKQNFLRKTKIKYSAYLAIDKRFLSDYCIQMFIICIAVTGIFALKCHSHTDLKKLK
jgi:hypothetical protein